MLPTFSKNKFPQSFQTYFNQNWKPLLTTRLLGLDMYTLVYQRYTKMPIMWDIPRQEFVSCEDSRETRWFRAECIVGMGIVAICYVTIFLQQIARSEDSSIPQVSLLSLISFFSAAQVSIYGASGAILVKNNGTEYARGYNFLKRLEDELVQG